MPLQRVSFLWVSFERRTPNRKSKRLEGAQKRVEDAARSAGNSEDLKSFFSLRLFPSSLQHLLALLYHSLPLARIPQPSSGECAHNRGGRHACESKRTHRPIDSQAAARPPRSLRRAPLSRRGVRRSGAFATTRPSCTRRPDESKRSLGLQQRRISLGETAENWSFCVMEENSREFFRLGRKSGGFYSEEHTPTVFLSPVFFTQHGCGHVQAPIDPPIDRSTD